MTIPLFGAPGDLFDRLGKLALLIKECGIYQAAQLVNMIDTTNGVVAQYNAESDLQAVMGASYQNQLNSVGGTVGALCQQMAQLTCNRMVFRDQPLINQNLQSMNIIQSMQEIIRQMKISGDSVLAMVVTGTPTAFTGTGDGVINYSTRRPLDGLVLENAYSESVLFTCTSDSYNGGARAGSESFRMNGVGSTNGVFNFDWPLGSNATSSVSAIDGNSDNSFGNKLTNSGFDSWTANVPDNWELVVGTAGSTLTEETSIVYDGDASAKFTGDGGGTLTQIRQQFGETTGTVGSLNPQTQYSVNLFLRRDGTPAGAGVLTVDLVDENFVVIQDQNSVGNSFTVNLTALTTNFVAYQGVFRTPAIMPEESYIRVRLSTALTNGRSVYLDKLSLGVMTQLYTSGPFFAVHAGSVPFQTGDYGRCQITNSRGVGSTLNTFQTAIARMIPIMYSSELLIPSSAVPTIVDATYIA